MAQISAVLICHNEQNNIGKALQSLQWTDEIIVVDSFSTDQTTSIVRSNFPQVKLLQRAFTSYADQKNWAIQQAQHKWVVILDADEWFAANVENQFKEIIENNSTFDAIRFPRVNYYMDQRVKYSGWQNDTVIRFINKYTCQYNNRIVHEEIETNGTILRTTIPIHHNTYKNIDHAINKVTLYSRLKAEEKFISGKKSGLLKMILKPAFVFFKFYIVRLGILDGKIGFIICKFSAYSEFLRQVTIWRLTQGEKLKKNE